MSVATERGHLNLGSADIGSADIGSAMSQFERGREASRYWNGTQFLIQGMVGMTIDEFIARFNPPFPTHIKMDVDGLEAAILNGALGTLADGRLRAVMIELSVTDLVEKTVSVKLLNSFGFRLSGTGEWQGTK